MKIRKKNQDMQKLIEDLNRHGSEKDAGAWKAIAKKLNRPRRKRHEVSLNTLEKHTKAKESVVVPGVVLGQGEIKKSLKVAALRFSKEAREKIEKAGGECMDIRELFEKNPKGNKIKIMG